MFHFHDKVKYGAAAASGKTIEEITFEINVKGIGIIAVVNGATPGQAIIVELPQTDAIKAQNMSHCDAGFYPVNIEIVTHDDFLLIYRFSCVYNSGSIWQMTFSSIVGRFCAAPYKRACSMMVVMSRGIPPERL